MRNGLGEWGNEKWARRINRNTERMGELKNGVGRMKEYDLGIGDRE